MGTETEHVTPTAKWRLSTRIAFRFAFAYLILYLLPFPLRLIFALPDAEFLSPVRSLAAKANELYREPWAALVGWVGRQVFQVEPTVHPTGSGDTLYDYVHFFCILMISIAVTVVWSLVDGRRAPYTRLHNGLRVYVRFALAVPLISYGAAKVIKSQFPNPPLDRLLQPFGDASPMGLLWTFMGASEPYNLIAGLGEMIPGILLTLRCTTLLGSLLAIGVMSHIVALNFCYDVPVKLYSAHLLAMACFLTLPDLRWMFDSLILGRQTQTRATVPISRRKWLNVALVGLRTVVVVWYVGATLYGVNESRKRFGDLAERSPFYGIWNVDEFEVDGEAKPPVVTDPLRWRRVIFDYPGMLAVQSMNDSRQRYRLNLDPNASTLTLFKRDDPSWKQTMAYERPEADLLILNGNLDGRQIRAKLRRQEVASFRLLARGFHWIQEYPFNY